MVLNVEKLTMKNEIPCPEHDTLINCLFFIPKTLSWRTRKTRRRNTWKEKH